MGLDRPSCQRLQPLTERFQTSQAELMRQLIAQTQPEAFPESWHRVVAGRPPRLAMQPKRRLPGGLPVVNAVIRRGYIGRQKARHDIAPYHRCRFIGLVKLTRLWRLLASAHQDTCHWFMCGGDRRW
jgi:hypothetical protein